MPGVFAAPMLRGGGGGGGGPYPASAFFSSDPMLSSGWEVVSGPSGFHWSGKTYVAWQFVGVGGNKGIHVAAYDHGSATWSERYTAGNFLLADDDHGHPALVRDAEGYVHCFFGSHNNAQKWSVTGAPDDISSWTQQSDISGSLTYPKAILIGSSIYLFIRDLSSNNNRRLSVRVITPSGGVGTPGTVTPLVDFGLDSRVYTSEAHAIGTSVHICCMYSHSTDSYRRDVYYMVFDTVTGAVSNYNGTTSIASGSLPITLAQANSNFRIFNHGLNDGDVPSLQFDTSGNAHVMFADGVTPDYDLKHMMLSGGSWSSPVTVAAIDDWSPSFGYVDTYCLVPGASGAMEAWYNLDGDKMRRVRSAGGTWATAEIIAPAGAYNFVGGAAIKGANSNFRTLFSESSGGAIDANAALLGLYAYGDSGGVPATIPVGAEDPAGWGNVVLLLDSKQRNAATSVIDASPASVRYTLGAGVSVDASVAPFPSRSSVRFTGAANAVMTGVDNSVFAASGSNDFCIDGWVRLNQVGKLQILLNKRNATSTAAGWSLLVTAANQLQFIGWGAAGAVVANLSSTATLSVGGWAFFEVSRISGVVYLFLNGSLEASGTPSGAITSPSTALILGHDPGVTGRNLNGWLFEPRFTLAGRHSSSYTVPSAPFPRR